MNLPVKRFADFKEALERCLLSHPVILANPYTRWFRLGLASPEQAVDLIVQFSVFSNHFLISQVKRMVHASTEEGERCARNILMNECGVSLDVPTGLVEGRMFSTANAHINWLREAGAVLGLKPMDLGRWDKAHATTRRFLLGLEASYGSPDGNIGAGASFAIENWAAFGIGDPAREHGNFWRELIQGLDGFNARQRLAKGKRPVPLGFFKFHFEIESGHGANVWRELEETFGRPGFDPSAFIAGGTRALAAIHAFWLGLEQSRRRLERRSLEPAPKTAGAFERLLEQIDVRHWAV